MGLKSFLGIDVGGANLKIAHKDKAEIIYFPMWKRARELESLLKNISKKYDAIKAGVVMTAELADVFESKKDGVNFVANACKNAFEEVVFLDIDGNLKDRIDDPLKFAASNWIASCKFLISEGFRNFLFVDIGSTTTDIIPVTDKIEAAKTDYERLKRGEMLYFGILRTPVFYILREFENAKLVPEYFSITADVFILTNDISSSDYTCETPDGKAKDRFCCMRRLARSLCCDVVEIGEEKIEEMAFTIKKEMVKEVSKAIKDKVEYYGLKKVFGCGIGEFLIKEACKNLGIECVLLSSIYGDFSKIFPAFAMMKLVEKL